MFNEANIPGSVNFPCSKMLNGETKILKFLEERTAAATEAGIDLNKDIVVSCRSGVQASFLYGALSDIHKGKLAMYDGSFSEYTKKNE